VCEMDHIALRIKDRSDIAQFGQIKPLRSDILVKRTHTFH